MTKVYDKYDKAVCIKRPNLSIDVYKVGVIYFYFCYQVEDDFYNVYFDNSYYTFNKYEFDKSFVDLVKYRNDKIDEILS